MVKESLRDFENGEMIQPNPPHATQRLNAHLGFSADTHLESDVSCGPMKHILFMCHFENADWWTRAGKSSLVHSGSNLIFSVDHCLLESYFFWVIVLDTCHSFPVNTANVDSLSQHQGPCGWLYGAFWTSAFLLSSSRCLVNCDGNLLSVYSAT